MVFKKILFGMSALAIFAACTEDYKDWVQPQGNAPVPAKTVEWSVAAAQDAAFVLDEIQDETVKLFNVTLPEGVTAESFNVNLTAEGSNYPDYNITADGQGNVSVADLQKATTEMFTIEAVERTFAAVVSSDVNVTGQEGSAAIHLLADAFNVTVVPQKPLFNPFIYFIGATDGWSASDQKLACLNGDGVYTGFCYVADPNGWGIAFKFQRVAGSWDNEINANTFTSKSGVFGDNNIEVAEEGVYYFQVNLAQNSISATKIDYMGVTGDYCGWNEGAEMMWNATDFCYELTGAAVNANGWKFRANGLTDPNWKINLGGDINNLTQDGANITLEGNTIKLYPTRKTSNNIYCTVE